MFRSWLEQCTSEEMHIKNIAKLHICPPIAGSVTAVLVDIGYTGHTKFDVSRLKC